MSSRIFISAAVTTICLAGFIWKGLGMQKEIPCQEVVPLNDGIAVINGESPQMNDKLAIVLYTDEVVVKRMVYNDGGICLMEGLDRNKRYTVEIGRTDLKGKILYKNLKIPVTFTENGKKYVVLVGASVGEAWEFEKLPERLHLNSQFIFGFRARYDFDKSPAIKSLADLPVPVSGVIIKECAAYFPRDIERNKKLITAWVDSLRANRIAPVLATVVPVTKQHDGKHPMRLASLLEFNDFIRHYASGEGIAVLDLEKALRISDKDRHLRSEYAQADGLHLRKEAYEILDVSVFPVVAGIGLDVTKKKIDH
jgi:hypothetical protein